MIESFGRYRLEEKLGQGGMGIVYRAFDTVLERMIALKMVLTTEGLDPELRERFFREARAAGHLAHRNIVTIFDLGEHNGRPYLAMEYLDGEDLQRRLGRTERMSLARKLEIAHEICQGIEHAHAHGIIHRDLKPANIFITATGGVKILDFGLARLMSSQLTQSNQLMGTLNYMAPEQVRGERADQQSDVFSIGVVLYELFGGRRAFEGDSVASTLYKILQETPVPLSKIDAGLPAELTRFIDRALAKLRDERYPDMASLRQDLESCLHLAQLSPSFTPRPPDLSTPPNNSVSPSHGVTPDTAAAPPASDRPHAGSGLSTPAPSAVRSPAPSRRWDLRLGSAALLIAVMVGVWALTRAKSQEPVNPVAPAVTRQTAEPPPAPVQTAERAPATAQPAAPPPPAAAAAPARQRKRDAAESRQQPAPAVVRETRPAPTDEAPAPPVSSAPRATASAETRTPAVSAPTSALTGAPAAPAIVVTPPVVPSPAAPSPPPSVSAAPSPSAAIPPSAIGADTASAEARVTELLRRYKDALESKNIDQLKRIWPSLSGGPEQAMRQEFQHAQQIDVVIDNPQMSIAGTEGRVTFRRKYSLVTVDGQRLQSTTQTVMQVRRAGAGWLIDGIQFSR